MEVSSETSDKIGFVEYNAKTIKISYLFYQKSQMCSKFLIDLVFLCKELTLEIYVVSFEFGVVIFFCSLMMM